MIETIEAVPEEIYDIELEHSLLEANAKIARDNRALLDKNGIKAIDVMGAIGSGKTTLITRLVGMLKDKIGVAVFNGDATTSTDYDAIAGMKVPVVQIATVNGAATLDANLVGKALLQTRTRQTETDLHREHREPDLPGGIPARLKGARGGGERDRGALHGAQTSAHVHGRGDRGDQQTRPCQRDGREH